MAAQITFATSADRIASIVTAIRNNQAVAMIREGQYWTGCFVSVM